MEVPDAPRRPAQHLTLRDRVTLNAQGARCELCCRRVKAAVQIRKWFMDRKVCQRVRAYVVYEQAAWGSVPRLSATSFKLATSHVLLQENLLFSLLDRECDSVGATLVALSSEFKLAVYSWDRRVNGWRCRLAQRPLAGTTDTPPPLANVKARALVLAGQLAAGQCDQRAEHRTPWLRPRDESGVGMKRWYGESNEERFKTTRFA